MAGPTPAAPGRIFISYRRNDTDFPAGWLYERLAERFGADQVFKDVDSIELGDDFVEAINRAVGSCNVLLAIIGDQWVTITDKHGQRRLDKPDDFVRLEVEAALARDVRLIPILVEGAPMPAAEELPASMAALSRRQALELSPNRFDLDTGRLLSVLDKTLAELGVGQAVEDTVELGPAPAPLPVPIPPPPAPPMPRPAPTPPVVVPPPGRFRWWLVPAVLLAVLLVVALVVRPWDRGGGGGGVEVVPLPPGTSELTVGYVAGFAAGEKDHGSLLHGGFDPILFRDPAGRLQGLDVDLAKALGDKLGVNFDFDPVPAFTHSLARVKRGDDDLSISLLRDRGEGREDVDFIDYLDPGGALLVPKEDADRIGSLDDLCGKTVVRPIEMPAGSVVDQSRRCLSESRRPVTLVSCPRISPNPDEDQPGVELKACPTGRDPLQLVLDGKADAAVMDLPVAERLLETPTLSRQLAIAEPRVEAGPYGIAVRKGDTQVMASVRSALRFIIEDGTYDQILGRWGLERFARRDATVNEAP
jgi:ABC-type amino acid transport substrate-binding protein